MPRLSSTCTSARSWAGRSPPICAPTSRWTLWRWRSLRGRPPPTAQRPDRRIQPISPPCDASQTLYLDLVPVRASGVAAATRHLTGVPESGLPARGTDRPPGVPNDAAGKASQMVSNMSAAIFAATGAVGGLAGVRPVPGGLGGVAQWRGEDHVFAGLPRYTRRRGWPTASRRPGRARRVRAEAFVEELLAWVRGWDSRLRDG